MPNLSGSERGMIMLKLNEMDFGTKLRTVLVIVSSLNTALMATDLTGFENPTVDLISSTLLLWH